jgi:hypothetical protein
VDNVGKLGTYLILGRKGITSRGKLWGKLSTYQKCYFQPQEVG